MQATKQHYKLLYFDIMKHYLTTSEAAVILQMLEKIKQAINNSPRIAEAYDIDRHDIAKVEAVINNLKK